MNFEFLPKDIHLEVFSKLDIKFIFCSICSVSRKWRSLVLDSPFLWIRINIPKKSRFLGDLILWAIYNNHIEMTMGIFKSQPSLIDLVDSSRNTLLWRAAANGNKRAVEILIKMKATMNVFPEHTSPLWIAASNGHSEICKILIQNKANIEFTTKQGGITPLWRASFHGHLECVKVLVENGAKLETKCKWNNNFPCTPLWISFHKGHIQVGEFLLSSGANITEMDILM